ncbi:thymidylate synthase [Pseudomonas fluorescens]|nr:thymidylate synthase [Pseudomonas fluorescens]
MAHQCGTIPATFSHTRIDHAHERPPHPQTCAQEA